MKKTATTPLFLVAAMILGLAGCATDGRQDSAGRVIDDTVITTKVKSAFVEDKKVSALNISVKTYNGVVQLSGVAADPQESWKAADIARHVEGVKSVSDQLMVKSS